jgi:hypothetical protein
MMQGPPPRLPNGLFAPEIVPRLPNHNKDPQDGRTYQFGDPGQAIGTIRSISSTFGEPRAYGAEPEECTFIGEHGLARATRQGMQILRFADAPWVMVKPIAVDLAKPHLSPSNWIFMDAQYRPLFQFKGYGLGTYFGFPAEVAFAAFHMPRAQEALARGDLRFWTGGRCYVHLTPDFVEVSQLGRCDRVPAKDISFALEDNFFELVLRAPQFYEARFLMSGVTNRQLLVTILAVQGATLAK